MEDKISIIDSKIDNKIDIKIKPITPIVKDKTELLQAETVKLAFKNGFKVDEFIHESYSDSNAYCPSCKTIKPIIGAYKLKYKNGVNFIRGKCSVCGSDCWKSLKE